MYKSILLISKMVNIQNKYNYISLHSQSMIFKIPWILEIKSYKTCQAEWDDIAIPFSC